MTMARMDDDDDYGGTIVLLFLLFVDFMSYDMLYVAYAWRERGDVIELCFCRCIFYL